MISTQLLLSYADARNGKRSNFGERPFDQRFLAIHWSVNSSNEWIIGVSQVPHDQLDWQADTCILCPIFDAPKRAHCDGVIFILCGGR